MKKSGGESRPDGQIATSISMTWSGCFEHEGLKKRHRGGSHVIFTKPGVRERITLQPEGSKAKAYQVRQVRAILLREQ
jgi:hypothetical protein